MRSRQPPSRQPIAIVDIGSNSVRLVVYSGAPRVPTPIFNEKVLAGLGAELAGTGELSARSQEKALAALRRYHLLIGHMGVKRTRVVATAAARDARNGAQFVKRIDAIGFDCEVLAAEEEARLAGEGVLSAFPAPTASSATSAAAASSWPMSAAARCGPRSRCRSGSSGWTTTKTATGGLDILGAGLKQSGWPTRARDGRSTWSAGRGARSPGST